MDYRVAKFPEALINGHLTAANSDVRAGGNAQKHLQRWQGLTIWWQSLFGMPEGMEASEDSMAEGDIPPMPRKGDETVEAAVADYLSAWLMEQKPNISAAYLSSLSYSCLEEYGPNSGKIVSAGVAPCLAASQMAAVNTAIGNINNLQDAVEPISIRAHHDQYGGVGVRTSCWTNNAEPRDDGAGESDSRTRGLPAMRRLEADAHRFQVINELPPAIEAGLRRCAEMGHTLRLSEIDRTFCIGNV